MAVSSRRTLVLRGEAPGVCLAQPKGLGSGVNSRDLTHGGIYGSFPGAMTRPIGVEYANAVYHVTAGGKERKTIYRDDADRQRFLETIAETVKRFGLASG